MSINLLTQAWAQEKKLKAHYFHEVTSTSDWAKTDFSNENQNFSLYLADHQTKGRGRGQNHWMDQGSGNTLLSTWCFKLNYTPQPVMTVLIGLCLFESLQKVFSDIQLRIKPPNDLFILDKKLSGLLIEVVEQGDQQSLFIGLGMNVFDSPKVDQPTTCLKDHAPLSEGTWKIFCDEFYKNLNQTINPPSKNQLSLSEQNRLLLALNQGLKGDEKFISISAQGDLYTTHQKISWFDL